MKPVYQTRFGPDGNCYSACLASILEIDLWDVPGLGDNWTKELADWLNAFNMQPIFLTLGWPGEGYEIVGQRMPDDMIHATVWLDGEIVHDPSPTFFASRLSDLAQNHLEGNMKHPFTAEEKKTLDLLSWWQRRKIRKNREGRIVDCWANSPDRSLMGGGVQGWEECLESITTDGVQISNSTTETIICPDFNIPAYYMAPGRTIRIWAFGVMSNVVTTPGTLTVWVRWGGVAGTVLVTSAAQGLDTTARTNSLWAMQAFVVCRTAGSTGTFESGGIFWGNVLSSTAANLLPALLGSAGTPLASGNTAVTVDTTTAKLLSCTAKFSVATSPTNLTAQQRIIEVLN